LKARAIEDLAKVEALQMALNDKDQEILGLQRAIDLLKQQNDGLERVNAELRRRVPEAIGDARGQTARSPFRDSLAIAKDEARTDVSSTVTTVRRPIPPPPSIKRGEPQR
jgi:hypothetical protein